MDVELQKQYALEKVVARLIASVKEEFEKEKKGKEEKEGIKFSRHFKS